MESSLSIWREAQLMDQPSAAAVVEHHADAQLERAPACSVKREGLRIGFAVANRTHLRRERLV